MNKDGKNVEVADVERLTNEYFGKGAAKIRRMSDSILKRIGYVTEYPEEFYSLAGEVFLSVIESWDGNRNFDSYLYSCLSNRFKSFLTKENAQKRGGVDKPDVSLSQEVGDGLTLEDTIGNEQEFNRSLSHEMLEYINSLNSTQKQIYLMITQGYEPREIQKRLGISSKIYNRELRDARSYEKIRVLKSRMKPEVKKQQTSQEKKGSAQPMPIKGSNERTDVTRTVSMLIEDVQDGTLRDDNPLQRATDNWNLEMKGNLIVTALNGFGIPEFVICERRVGDSSVKEIIDGLQRFSAFSGYVANSYRISKKVERPFVSYKTWKRDENGEGIVEDGLPVYEDKLFDVRGKKFADLPRELQKKIEGYGIHCDTYLNCTNEDVEYHIRRLNSSRSMNHSQRGLTFIGSTLAAVVKTISRKDFFRDTYKVTDFRNGNVQRLISESVMLINFADDWIPSPEKIGAFLGENAKSEQFEHFGDLVDRVDEILDEDTRKLFNMRDSFLWFRIFNDFTKIGIEDEKFNDFLREFDNLKTKEIDGETFDSLNTKNTKAASPIQKKVSYIEALMYEYIDVEPEESLDLQYSDEVGEFVERFCDVTKEDVVSDDKTAIKTAFALKGKEDLSDSSIQAALDSGELVEEDLWNAITFTEDFIDDWVINSNTSIVNKEKLPALVRLYKDTTESDVEANRIQNWFVNFSDQERVNHRLTGNYKKDYEVLKKAFESFVNYETLGVA